MLELYWGSLTVGLSTEYSSQHGGTDHYSNLSFSSYLKEFANLASERMVK